MYIGREAINNYLDGTKGHLILKKGELHFVKKISFSLRFQAFFGFGKAAESNIFSFINTHRKELFQDQEKLTHFNGRITSYNKKCFIWWNKAKLIQDISIQEVAKSLISKNSIVDPKEKPKNSEPMQKAPPPPPPPPPKKDNKAPPKKKEEPQPKQAPTFKDELKEKLKNRRKATEEQPKETPSVDAHQETPKLEEETPKLEEETPKPEEETPPVIDDLPTINLVEEEPPQDEEMVDTLKRNLSNMNLGAGSCVRGKKEATVSDSTLNAEQDWN